MTLKAVLLSASILTSVEAGTVTFVTHGMDSNAKTWVREMCMAMHQYQRNLGFENDVFYVELPRQNSVQTLPQFIVQPLTTTSTNQDRNVIIAFDWSYYATSFLKITVDFNTVDVAPLPAYFLRKNDPLPGFPDPLVESPLHLVGHSRGGSLLSGVCDILARVGIPVAHLTTLDPRAHPVSLDVRPHVATNVLFADNYFQTYDTITFGDRLEGAYNRQPILWDSYLAVNPPVPTVNDGHEAVHNWYHRTIGELPIVGNAVMQGFYSQWFTPDDMGGTRTGYYFAFCPFGVRPLDGFRSRRLGYPSLALTNSPDGTNTVFSISGGATGKYFFEVAADPTRWVTTTNFFLLDGRPLNDPIPRESLSGRNLFFRLRSVDKSF